MLIVLPIRSHFSAWLRAGLLSALFFQHTLYKTYTRPLEMYNKKDWPLTLYFDGQCPLCAREIKILNRHAAESRLLFIDISSGEFDAKALGFTFEQMQSTLHARFADGRWVTGLDATLWSWRAAGLGFWAAPLTWRAIRPLLALGYRLFCRLRPHLAWLPHPDGRRRCVDDRCGVPESKPAPDERPTLKTKQT
ncbi:Predicted thiol-disulfide oxidoreductase YuxK, DCC family [Pseudomonas arsenicoxydans]|uniref:Predicted thiol-disulfide oxidoreductase YuxK, DCC family n=2 Tax=Pseudomonas arsenicoxydans TaxID=702115 RepID=A0A1H0P2S1_9PSED|nr:Predicted thiol-disulfide oxidoreductase YuxK, DCC family [Pseudomonas arsenicoxydans]